MSHNPRGAAESTPPTTVYLHIGPPKTATTFIQEVLWAERSVLAEYGITFVGNHFSDHFYAALDVRNFQLGESPDPRRVGAWEKLVAQVRSAPTPAVFISHEMFAAAKAEEIASMISDLQPADVHVIYGLRDLGRQIPAVWQEGVKNRWKLTWHDFLQTLLRDGKGYYMFWAAQNAPEVLDRWQAAVGADHIHVITMPPTGAPRDLFWRRFCSLLEIDPDRFDLSKSIPNASLSFGQAELLRRVNVQLDDAPKPMPWPRYLSLIKSQFNIVANSGGGKTRLKVPVEFTEDVRNRAQQLIEELAAKNYHVIGDLDDARPLDSAFSDDPPPTGDELAAEAVDVFVVNALRQSKRMDRRQPKPGSQTKARQPTPQRKPQTPLPTGTVHRARRLLGKVKRRVLTGLRRLRRR